MIWPTRAVGRGRGRPPYATAFLYAVFVQLQVRRFRRRDLNRILAIERACFERDAYPEEMFLDLSRECGPLFLVAWRRTAPVGYVVSCANGSRAEIVSIAVAPGCRERGVGSLLMAYTLRKLRRLGVCHVGLMVHAANSAALRLYRRFGFLRVRLAPGYYGDGGTGVRMRLRLTS